MQLCCIKVYICTMEKIKMQSDYIGIIGSGLCFIHCILTPVVLSAGLFIPSTESESFFSLGHLLELLFVLIAFFAVFNSSSRTPCYEVRMAFWSFFTLFAVGILFHDHFKWMVYVSYLGSLGLIVTHIINIKNCKRCNKG